MVLSAAVFALCLDFCFLRAGGRFVLTPVSAAIALAISWHSSVGYSHSSSVANFHPFSAWFQLTPHFSCSDFLCVHCFCRLSSSVELVRNAVFLGRLPPHMHAWNSILRVSACSMTFFMQGISHMIEFVGFSMEKIFPCCMQYVAISAQNSVIMFPFWTLTVSVLDILAGSPAGNSVDLNGFGFGMFGHLSSFHCAIGISRALVNVPHGGARWT